MFPIILQAGISTSRVPYSLRVVFLLLFLAGMVNAWRRWVNRALKTADGSIQNRYKLKWRLRPSNLLMLVSGVSLIYWGLHQESAASGYLFTLSWIGIGAAFVVRHWEDQSFKQ
jgi:hypothetical protein